jgi:hypothetical protein
MIDPTTGDIDLGSGATAGPGLTEQAFRASPPGAAADPIPAAPPWSGWRVRRHGASGAMFAISLRFQAGKLALAEIVELDPDAGGWDDWSEQKELAKKARHDALLAAWLGPPPWKYAWGEVTSTFDPRGGYAGITVRYA